MGVLTATRGVGMFGGTLLPLIGMVLVPLGSALSLRAGASWRQVLPVALFCLYLFFAVDMALFPVSLDPLSREMTAENWQYWHNSVNVVPLRTIFAQLSTGAPPQAFAQVLGNLALLVPFGLLAPMVFRKLRDVRAFVLSALAIAIGIEALQLLEWVALLSSRSIDIDDVILNTAGALLGFLIWAVAQRLVCRRQKDSEREPAARSAV